MAVAMQYGNGRNGLANIGMSMTLLWTNLDDESAFAAQSISLSLGGYDAVLIKFKLTATGTTYGNTIGFVGEETTLFSSNASTTSYTYKRYATITTSDITFTTGYRNTSTGTSYAVPCEIYGIKRGGTSGGSSSSGSGGGGGGGTGTLTRVTFDGTVYTDDGTGNVTLDESDPVFAASDAYGITSTDISNWNAKATVTVLTATIAAADWAGSAPCTNAVTVTGLLASDTPTMDLVASSTYATAQTETADYAKIYKATCSSGTLTVYATDAPSVDLNIQLVCVR